MVGINCIEKAQRRQTGAHTEKEAKGSFYHALLIKKLKLALSNLFGSWTLWLPECLSRMKSFSDKNIFRRTLFSVYENLINDNIGKCNFARFLFMFTEASSYLAFVGWSWIGLYLLFGSYVFVFFYNVEGNWFNPDKNKEGRFYGLVCHIHWFFLWYNCKNISTDWIVFSLSMWSVLDVSFVLHVFEFLNAGTVTNPPPISFLAWIKKVGTFQVFQSYL